MAADPNTADLKRNRVTSPTWAQHLITRGAASPTGALNILRRRHGRLVSWLVAAVYFGCLTAFVADLMSLNTVAFGVFYVPLVGTAMFHDDDRAVGVLTAAACVMVALGSVIPDIPANLHDLIWNRALSICAILATAAFVHRARKIQAQLAEQTARAESAERMKTEVLNNLSQEIRAPLYSMIGVLDLVAAGARPDQHAAVAMVRGSGRHLVATIDNLIDLTQFEDRTLNPETLDLGVLLRRTVETLRPDARARQIELVMETAPEHELLVFASPWAVRRILENKIADAISFTMPGGRIATRAVRRENEVFAEIVTPGSWPAGVTPKPGTQDLVPMSPSLMGLALSQRLAKAIGARLAFNITSHEGTAVRLWLPGAPPDRDGGRPDHASR